MAYIQVIDYENTSGELKEIYNHIVETRGKLAEIHKIHSLHPESIVKHMDLYMCIMFGKSPLKRYQREMIAVVVSSTNQCEYCQEHHSQALLHYWKDNAKVNMLKKDYTQVSLSPVDKSLCDYAYHLTKRSDDHLIKKTVDELKDKGLNDRAILDANHVVAYFNYVNRIVIGLGVHLEEDRGKGYKY